MKAKNVIRCGHRSGCIAVANNVIVHDGKPLAYFCQLHFEEFDENLRIVLEERQCLKDSGVHPLLINRIIYNRFFGGEN